MDLRASEIKAIGIEVTTICKLGGVGLGYILPDDCFKNGKRPENIAWQSCGNGFYSPREFKEIIVDGGKGYADKINELVSGGSLSKNYKI